MSEAVADEADEPVADVAKEQRKSFLWGCVTPLIALIFFAVGPAWLENRVHEQVEQSLQKSRLAPAEKARRTAALAEINFGEVCRAAPAQFKGLRDDLVKAGICARFDRLRWGLWLAGGLCAWLAIAGGTMVWLGRTAARSRDALIRCYRRGWTLAMITGFVKVSLLIPLLTYGAYELTVLLTGKFFVQLLVAIALGGVIALWRSVAILLRKVPMEFEESLSRAVTPQEAPELWAAVREAAARLQTEPPDHIVVGMQLNFYVTELAVKTAAGSVEGRTLFLSYPMLKQMSAEEVLAIVGHELGHFIGADTRMTREFYPLRHKAHATIVALIQSGWVGRASRQFLEFFHWSFVATEQEMSRQRELLADAKAAELTSRETAARALVNFSVVHEAFQMGFEEALRKQVANPFDVPMRPFIRETLAPKAEFWRALFASKSPHPLDSHPALHVRLEALGRPFATEEAIALATSEVATAHAAWLAARDELFTELNRQAVEEVAKMRSQYQVAQADVETEDGRKLLETHFPTRTWRGRRGRFWVISGTVWLFTAVGLLVAVVAEELGAGRWWFGAGAALLAAMGVAIWVRHWGAELVLEAHQIRYSGWRRPLVFADVAAINVQPHSSELTVLFVLKTRQSRFWKATPFLGPTQTLSLPLSWIDAKQQELAETIGRYVTRQLAQ